MVDGFMQEKARTKQKNLPHSVNFATAMQRPTNKQMKRKKGRSRLKASVDGE